MQLVRGSIVRLYSACCLNVCSGRLTVSTTNKVLLGTVGKSCGCCLGSGSSFMTIENENGKVIF